MRLPLWLWSTSALSECKMAVTSTTFPLAGLTVIGPYWFITETLAWRPTLKRNSFRLSATTKVVPARTTTTASCAARLLLFMILLPRRPCPPSRGPNIPILWQRSVQGHLIDHGFLLVGIH